MSRLGALVAWLGMTACASSSNVAANGGTAGAPVQGTYVFSANLPDQQMRGTLQVMGDRVLLEPASGKCRAIESSDAVVHFSCTGSGRYEQMSIRINRRKPAEGSTWSASYLVQRSREVCQEYGVVSGRQVCVRSWTEYYDVAQGKSGKLRVRRTS
jgi:hypothetical protein